MAGKVTAALSEPLDFDSDRLYISLSMGISMFPRDGEDIDALVKNADAAMYKAKRSPAPWSGWARTLNLDIIAEGVEREACVQFLLREGCYFGQGYLWGKPMPEPEVAQWLAEHTGA